MGLPVPDETAEPDGDDEPEAPLVKGTEDTPVPVPIGPEPELEKDG